MLQLENELKNYILQRHLPGEDASWLHADYDLIASGILDSLALMSLLTHLEHVYDVQLRPEEITAECFATLSAIVQLVRHKRMNAQRPHV